MKHVVMYSGGICSFMTAKRVVERHPGEEIVLLFADTNIEDPDLYRFLEEGADYLRLRVTRIADGRTPWQIFDQNNIIPGGRIDPCSSILKRQLLDKWQKQHCDPCNTILHYGLDWTEIPRFEVLQSHKRKCGWECRAYMIERPWLAKKEMISEVKELGIRIPLLYWLGFAHNNCGGFCIKAGQAQFALLLKHFPDRYAEHEAWEQKIRSRTRTEYALIKRTINGKKTFITLREFREEIEAGQKHDELDFGGCGCAVDV